MEEARHRERRRMETLDPLSRYPHPPEPETSAGRRGKRSGTVLSPLGHEHAPPLVGAPRGQLPAVFRIHLPAVFHLESDATHHFTSRIGLKVSHGNSNVADRSRLARLPARKAAQIPRALAAR